MTSAFVADKVALIFSSSSLLAKGYINFAIMANLLHGHDIARGHTSRSASVKRGVFRFPSPADWCGCAVKDAHPDVWQAGGVAGARRARTRIRHVAEVVEMPLEPEGQLLRAPPGGGRPAPE